MSRSPSRGRENLGRGGGSDGGRHHLGGALTVAMADALTACGLVTWEDGPALTASGAAWLRRVGVEEAVERRHLRTCLDWTERRPRLAGAPAAALFRHALGASWPVHGDGARVLRLTDRGRDALRRHLGLAEDVTAVGPARWNRRAQNRFCCCGCPYG